MRSGRSPAAGPTGPALTTRWAYGDSTALTSAVVGAGGLVFAGSSNGTVRAVNATSGVLVWMTAVGNPVDLAPSLDFYGTLFVSSTASVHALSAASGEMVWSVSVASVPVAAPSVFGTSVYLALQGSLQARSASTGKSQWTYTGNVTTGPTLCGDGSLVLFGAGASVVAVHSANGTVAWTSAMVSAVLSPVSVAPSASGAAGTTCAGTAFVVTGEGLVALNASTGAQAWVCPSVSEAGTPAAVALGASGLVFFTTQSLLIGVQASTGVGVWQYTLKAPVGSVAVAAGDVVLVTNLDAFRTRVLVVAVDGGTGYYLWGTTLGEGAAGSVVLSSEKQVVAMVGGKLFGVEGGWGVVVACRGPCVRLVGSSFGLVEVAACEYSSP